MVLARGSDLDIWSERMDARIQFPRLVRRLIFATGKDVSDNDFRADEGVGVPGWDGKVAAAGHMPFVPVGVSRWELSTSGDLPDNATRNYTKRTADPLGANPAESTFVYVTTRRWSDRDDWVDRKRKEGIWRDVLAYDADKLEG